ncbi:hypothetical protein AAFN85_28125 [Mucilaginibacter sp. CAU 1740]|uniref:hypothetical protein n=1 Tax=Mucilaginibacter sp. CAU 1740 TaxID=3140365 RepID=UPI00325B1131
MKAQQNFNNNAQGKPTADRAFTNHNDAQKQKGISNARGTTLRSNIGQGQYPSSRA